MIRSIPIVFLPDRLAVNESGAVAMLSLDGRSKEATRKAWWRFRKMNGIRPIPGTDVFSVRQLQTALDRNLKS